MAIGAFHTSLALQSNTRFVGDCLAWHFARLHPSRVMCGVKIELTATDAREMEFPQKFHSSEQRLRFFAGHEGVFCDARGA